MGITRHLKNPVSAGQKIAEALQERLIWSGLLDGSDEQTRFIVLGWYRTGSNLLLSSLYSHPEVVAYSELFFTRWIFWGNWIYRKKEKEGEIQALRDRDPQAFLDRYIFRAYPKRIRAVGFKVFYSQLISDHYEDLASVIQAIPGLKVIHLKRENKLRMYLSSRIAERTGVMNQVDAREQIRIDPIEIDPEDCLAFIEKVRSLEDRFSEAFQEENRLELRYEELVRDQKGHFDQVQDFLGIERRDLHSPLKKQNPSPVKDLVANYEELCNYFAGTSYEGYLEE